MRLSSCTKLLSLIDSCRQQFSERFRQNFDDSCGREGPVRRRPLPNPDLGAQRLRRTRNPGQHSSKVFLPLSLSTSPCNLFVYPLEKGIQHLFTLHFSQKRGCPNLAKCSCYLGLSGWTIRHLCRFTDYVYNKIRLQRLA